MAGVRYDNPVGLIVGTAVLQILAALSVGLRFYTRRWKEQNIIASDWLILVAFIFGAGLTALEFYGIATHALAYPVGASIEDPASVTDRLNRTKYVEFAFLILGIVGIGMLKLSVCMLYWHLFAQLKFRHFLIFWIVVIALWTASFSIALFAECGNHFLALFAQPEDYTLHCGAAIPGGWAYVGTDVFTDIATLIIPIPVVLELQMSRQLKVLSILVFSIGALSVGASAVKAYIYVSATLNRYTEDAILTLTGLSIWNLAEIQIGIIAACGPVLRGIAIRLVPTESLSSLFGSWGWPSRQISNRESSFVKMQRSDERLRRAGQSDGDTDRNADSMPSYELERRNNSNYS